MGEEYHIAVMLKESVDALDVKADGIYADATMGGGSHSREILRRLGAEGRLYSFDQDADAERNIPADERLTFVRSNFRYLRQWMRYYGVDHIDGLLADLGVSAHHFDTPERGFSLRYDAPIDMRMNTRAGKTAADILAEYSEEELAGVIRLYGELREARQIAAAIVRARAKEPIATTGDLVDIASPLLRKERAKKDLSKLFQALRIETNHETEALADLMRAAAVCLRKGGRMVVLTYHSIEDRIVKNMIRTGNAYGRQEKDFFGNTHAPFKAICKAEPSEEERQRNPRSRSAMMRVAERI